MDYSLGEETLAAVEVARRVVDVVAESDDSEGRELWARSVDADLTGLALGTDVGGSGSNLEAVCAVLECVGRGGLQAPLWAPFAATLAFDALRGAGPVDSLSRQILDGGCRPTIARMARGATVEAGTVNAVIDFLPWATVADTLVLPVSKSIAIVDLTRPGVERHERVTTAGTTEARLQLRSMPCDVVTEDDGIVDMVIQMSSMCLIATQLGVLEGALATAVEHLGEREQFGRRLSTFQSVQHRLADAVIAIEGLRWSLMSAVVAIGSDRDAATDCQIAHSWAASAPRILSELTHLLGGTGVDRSHRMHRYFLVGRLLDLTIGPPDAGHEEIGRRLLAGSIHG